MSEIQTSPNFRQLACIRILDMQILDTCPKTGRLNGITPKGYDIRKRTDWLRLVYRQQKLSEIWTCHCPDFGI